jgi:glycosyltransferase involved in cell wall biosynthesis
MESLVSIIIPVYNVDKYLDECLHSVIKQTYKNIEIILVDDGSTDKSGKICDEYTEVDSRIKLIHKTNEGVSVARNTGIELSTGEWIMFVDADDWIETDIVEKLLESIKIYNADICYCNYYIVEKNRQILRNFEGNNQNEHINFNPKFYRQAFASVYSKLYRRSLLINKDVRFIKNLKVNEDIVFNLHVFDFNPKVCYCDAVLYHYRMSASSVTHAFDFKAMGTLATVVKEYEKYILQKDNEMTDDKKRLVSYYIIGLIIGLYTNYVSNKFSIGDFCVKRYEIKKILLQDRYKWAIRTAPIIYMDSLAMAAGCYLLKLRQITLFYFFCKLRSLRRKIQAE